MIWEGGAENHANKTEVKFVAEWMDLEIGCLAVMAPSLCMIWDGGAENHANKTEVKFVAGWMDLEIGCLEVLAPYLPMPWFLVGTGTISAHAFGHRSRWVTSGPRHTDMDANAHLNADVSRSFDHHVRQHIYFCPKFQIQFSYLTL